MTDKDLFGARPHPTREDRLIARLKSIATTATDAQDCLGDLEVLGSHLDGMAEDLQQAMRIANGDA